MSGTKIILNSGRVFDFDNPSACDFVIEDFAHSLSMACRWNGHTNSFYSVAEHSYRVSMIVPEKFALQGLTHELAESLVGDCCSPLKYMTKDLRDVEKRIEPIIFERFGIDYPLDSSIKEADYTLLATEARDLMPKEAFVELDVLKHYKPLKKIIRPWSPSKAKRKFLERYYELVSK